MTQCIFLIRYLSFIVCALLFACCTSYKVPVPIKSHPACPDADVCQIELSPILDTGNVDAVF